EGRHADDGIRPRKTLAEIEHGDRSRQRLELGNHPPVVGVTAGRGRQIARNGKNERANHGKFASQKARAHGGSAIVTRIAASPAPSRPSAPLRTASARQSNTCLVRNSVVVLRPANSSRSSRLR